MNEPRLTVPGEEMEERTLAWGLHDSSAPGIHFSGTIRPNRGMAALQFGDTMWVEAQRVSDGTRYLVGGQVTRRTWSREGVELRAIFQLEDGVTYTLDVLVPHE